VILVWASALSFFHEVGPQDITRLALHRVDRRRRIAPHRPLAGPDGRQGRVSAVTTTPTRRRGCPSSRFLPSSCSARSACSARRTSNPGSGRTAATCGRSVRSLGGLGFLALVVLVGRVAEGVEPGTERSPRASIGLGTLAAPLGRNDVRPPPGGGARLRRVRRGLVRARRDGRRDLRFAAAGLCAGLPCSRSTRRSSSRRRLVYVAVRTLRGAAFFAAAAVPRRWRSCRLRRTRRSTRRSPVVSLRRLELRKRAGQGFFGIGVPDPGRLWQVLFDLDGLLPRSPILVLSPSAWCSSGKGDPRRGCALRCRDTRVPRPEHGLLRHSRRRVPGAYASSSRRFRSSASASRARSGRWPTADARRGGALGRPR
jgi:hypothetical protein